MLRIRWAILCKIFMLAHSPLDNKSPPISGMVTRVCSANGDWEPVIETCFKDFLSEIETTVSQSIIKITVFLYYNF